MSFDLTFFDTENAPSDEDEFEDWLGGQEEDSEWGASVEICAPSLRRFFSELRLIFPPFADELTKDVADNRPAEYAFSKYTIEAGFAFSVVNELEPVAVALAQKYNIGIYDEQDGELTLPSKGQ